MKVNGYDELPAEIPFNIPGIIIGVWGTLICLGAVTLPATHIVSMLCGLTMLTVNSSQLIRFPITLSKPTESAIAVWGCLFAVWGIVTLVAVVHALLVISGAIA